MPDAWLRGLDVLFLGFKILSNPLYEGRILKVAAMEAMEAMECGGSWIMKLQECLRSFGWCGVEAEEVHGLYSGQIKAMLETCANRSIEDESACELSTKPKLAILQLLKEKGSEPSYWDVASKSQRQVMMMLRGGTAHLMIESGWWRRLPRGERMCWECQLGKVEDVSHWVLTCDAWRMERQPLLQCMRHSITDCGSLCDDDKLVWVIGQRVPAPVTIESYYEYVGCSIPLTSLLKYLV